MLVSPALSFCSWRRPGAGPRERQYRGPASPACQRARVHVAKLETMVNIAKLALGGIIAGMFISYCVVLETTCTNTDPNEGAGELVITRGGSAKETATGTRFLAPLFVDAGATIAKNGTVEAELLWVANLCDGVLDCSACPFIFEPRFNTSALRGKILIYEDSTREELYMCGCNRLGRTFGATGLVALGKGSKTTTRGFVPGFYHKWYRLGDHRDSKPRDGDAGIPFPHFDVTQYTFSHFLLESGLSKGAQIRAMLTPTAPNPWRSTFCGYWKPFGTLLMLGHASVVERAASNWLGHIRTSDLRFDLAQLALANEMVAHCLMLLVHHDPFMGFHWAVFPYGATAAFVAGSILLTCSSTLLLAAYW